MKSRCVFPRCFDALEATISMNSSSPDGPFNLAKMIVGSEGTLGIVLEAKLNLVPVPKFKSVWQFSSRTRSKRSPPRL